jgi:predicted MPP superfamily phosphohydrolase
MRALGAALLGAAGAGAYAFYEPFRFRIQRHRLRGRPGSASLTVLHISDAHMRGDQHRKQAFLRSLPKAIGATPDLVVATGDMIDDDSGIDPVLECMALLEARLGRFFVLGSHDYFQSKYRPPTKYFVKKSDLVVVAKTDIGRMTSSLSEQGWIDLTNRTEMLDTAEGRLRMAGVDDPYLGKERTGHIERAADEAIAIGLVHAPDVVAEWILNGFDLVVAGHTHGGQVRFPGAGALVTNSSLPTALAAGPTRVGDAWLHVSPGVGSSRFAPIRFLCRPEVTLLELRP